MNLSKEKIFDSETKIKDYMIVHLTEIIRGGVPGDLNYKALIEMAN